MTPNPARVLVIVNVYRPDLGGGILFADLCEGLVERGMEVTVKCAYSYYPEWRDKSGLNGWKIRSTLENGVAVERHGIFIPYDPNSLLQRLVYETSFYLSLRRRRPKRGTFDLIIVFCPLVSAVAYALSVGRKLRVPIWLNIQDLSAQAAAAGGITGHKGLSRLLVRIQNALFARTDVCSSISEPMVETLDDLRSGSSPVRLIPNWLHRSLRDEIERCLESGLPARRGSVKILYSGSIGTKQDLLSVCRYLHGTDADFFLRIQGEGGRAPELRSWLESVGDPRIEMHPLSDEKGLAEALAEADYYLITEKQGAGKSFVPSKLIPGLASGTPIIAVSDSDSPLGREMEQFSPGPRIDWSNLSTLKNVLKRETIDSDPYRRWKENAYNRSSYFDREIGIDRCAGMIGEMLGCR